MATCGRSRDGEGSRAYSTAPEHLAIRRHTDTNLVPVDAILHRGMVIVQLAYEDSQ